MTRRCVVTGEDANGKSVFVSDEMMTPIVRRPGADMYRVWGGDAVPTLPVDGTRPDTPLLFPPPGGYRFVFTTHPPQSVAQQPVSEEQAASMQATVEGLGITDLFEPEHPGFHRTDTIDFVVVLSGQLWLQLDDGAEVQLNAGDCVVQNGTRHAWHNRSDEPCVIMAACVGAARS
jgi:quercetin dioxygenase-like cupin family protein